MDRRRLVLSKKRFFLDLQSTSPTSDVISAMVKDIEALGGVFDSFFSQEVSIVITDAPESVVELHCRKYKSSVDKKTVDGSSPLAMLLPSPPSPFSRSHVPITVLLTRNKLHMHHMSSRTRVDTIMERATRRASLLARRGGSAASGAGGVMTSDVIENAFKWGLKVWCVAKVIKWITNYKKRMSINDSYCGDFNDSVIDEDEDEKSITVLKRPYLKVDDEKGQLKPFWYEFSNDTNTEKKELVIKKGFSGFPKLNFDGEFGTSPFIEGNAEAKRTLLALNNGHQQPQRVKHVKRPRRKDGYCEVCQHNYLDLETHVVSKEHIIVTHDDHYWSRFDQLLQEDEKGNIL